MVWPVIGVLMTTAAATTVPEPVAASVVSAPSSHPSSSVAPRSEDESSWRDVAGPTLGQAPPSTPSRTVEIDVPVEPAKGTTSVSIDLSPDQVLAAGAREAVERADTRAEDGAPLRVGIIGFFDADLLRRQISRGLLPTIPQGNRACFVRDGRCPFGTPGSVTGNTVAAEMYLGRRPTEFFLVEASSLPAQRRAIDWLDTKDVSVVVPLALVPWDDGGDGTGPAARLLATAVEKGMYVVPAAGDPAVEPGYSFYAGAYWRGRWQDRDRDDWLEFRPDDESLGAYCGLLYGMRWDDWGGRATDYDLYVSDATRTPQGIVDGDDLRAIGRRDQSRRNPVPIEANDFRRLCNTDPRFGPVYDRNGDRFVSLWVRRTGRSSERATGDVIELMLLNGWLEHSQTDRSLQDTWATASSPGVITVGADLDGDLAWFSGHGPTNDGRVKPDVVADGCHGARDPSACGQDDDAFRSTTIAAGAVARGLAGMVEDLGATSVDDVRWLVRTFAVQSRFDRPWPNPGAGYGRFTSVLPPPTELALQEAPFARASRIRSPPGTADDLDRTFSSFRPGSSANPPTPLRPRVVLVTVTGARRAGTVSLWGRGQVPSSAVSIDFDASPGRQTRLVALRDTTLLWVRARTGGDVTVTTGLGLAAMNGTWPAYAVLDEPIPLRRAADGVLPARRAVSVVPPVSFVLDGGDPVYRVTVHAPTRSGTVQLSDGTAYPIDAGRTVTIHSALVTPSISATVPVVLDIDIVGRVPSERRLGWKRTEVSTSVTLAAGVETPVTLGSSGGTTARQYLLQIRSRSTGAATLSTVEDGVPRALVGLRPGRDVTGVIVRAVGNRVVLRSTAAVTLDIDVLSTTLYRSPVLDVVEPPSWIGANVAMTPDASVLVAEPFFEVSTDVSVWDVRAGTVDTLTLPAPPQPLQLPTLLGISEDGTRVAYTYSSTGAPLVIHDITADTSQSIPLPAGVVGNLQATTGDLTRFLSSSGQIVDLDAGTLVVVRDLGTVNGMSRDGRRFVGHPGGTGPESIMDEDGAVIARVRTSRVSSLSADGRSYVMGNGTIVTEGASDRSLCPGDITARVESASLSRDGGRVLAFVTCPAYDLEGLVLFDGSTRRQLTGDRLVGYRISVDGSTALLAVDGRIGLLALDDR